MQEGRAVRLTLLLGDPRKQAPGRPVPELRAQQGKRQHTQLRTRRLPGK